MELHRHTRSTLKSGMYFGTIPKWLLDEIEADHAWDSTFAKSPTLLASLASEALHEKNARDAHPLIRLFARSFEILNDTAFSSVFRKSAAAHSTASPRRISAILGRSLSAWFTVQAISGHENFYSARINLDYRAVCVLEGDIATWFWVGTHSGYDKLLSEAWRIGRITRQCTGVTSLRYPVTAAVPLAIYDRRFQRKRRIESNDLVRGRW